MQRAQSTVPQYGNRMQRPPSPLPRPGSSFMQRPPSRAASPIPQPGASYMQRPPSRAGASSLQPGTSTTRIDAMQGSQGQRAASIDPKELRARQLVGLHNAMRVGLTDFTGTAQAPLPEPGTGSLSAVLDPILARKLYDEIQANAHKLPSATYAEKEMMVRSFERTPGRNSPNALKLLAWAQSYRPTLYVEYVKASFNNMIRQCTFTQTGKQRDNEDVIAALQGVINEIKKAYDEARKQFLEETKTGQGPSYGRYHPIGPGM